MIFSLFLSLSLASAGVGGFVSIQFPYSGDRAQLFSQLSVVVRTPQGSLIDTAEVQPTGYWIIPTPTQREIVAELKAPEGIVVSPKNAFAQFPFNTDVNFQIKGFSVTGSILAKNGNNELVHVTAQLQVEVTNEKDITLVEMSNSDGTYSVGPLPPGEYKVTLRDAVVDAQTVVVTKPNEECKPLVIIEWAQNGVVEFPENVKAHPVSLQLVETNQIIETDKNGRFSIKGLNVGSYQLKSAVDGIIIKPAQFTISASKLPTPIVMKYEGVRVQGKVLYPNGDPLPKALVSLNPGNYQTETDENGIFAFSPLLEIENPILNTEIPNYKFKIPQIPIISNEPINDVLITVTDAPISGIVECPTANIVFEGAVENKMTVTNGKFVITAPYGKEVTVKAESQCGFEYNEITVKAPSKAIKFARVKATVSGSVNCLDKCNKETAIGLENKQYKYQGNLNENGKFVIEDVEFGKYQISVLSTNNEEFKLFENDVIVNGKTIEIGNIAEQTNYVYNITSSHEMKVKCGENEISLNRGLNLIKSKATLIKPNDCHIFKEVDIKSQKRIIVDAVERYVEVNGEEGTYTVKLNGKELEAPYKFVQKMDEEFVISITAIPPYVVEPPQIKVKAVQKCEDTGIHFDVIRGIEYSGKIQPPVEGVSMSAISEGKVISTSITNEQGEYSLGSYPSNIKIEVTASKDGYKFTKVDKTFNFVSEKLSSIIINFEHAQNAEIQGILLSISRQDGYAQNFIVDSETVTIPNLEKGRYYIKPILREHEFTPSQVSVDLQETLEKEISFSILRVKFGISGEVRRITGEYEPDIEIEAVYSNGEHQTTVTDAKGKFRIGGLQPNQTIMLLARATETSLIQTVTPSQIKIKMGNEEYKNVRFLSMKPIRSFDIIGELKVEPDFIQAMNVILMTPTGQVVERFSYPSKSNNLFYFTNLTNDKYIVRAAYTRLDGTKFNCTNLEIERQQIEPHISIECHIIESKSNIESENNSNIIATIITLLVGIFWLFIFNFNRIKEIFNQIKNSIIPSKKSRKQNIKNSSSSSRKSHFK